MTQKSDYVTDKAAWHAGEKFYELLFLYYQDMLEAKKMGDVRGMVNTFDEILIHVLPYVTKKMSKEDKVMFKSNQEIFALEAEYCESNTSEEEMANYQIQ